MRSRDLRGARGAAGRGRAALARALALIVCLAAGALKAAAGRETSGAGAHTPTAAVPAGISVPTDSGATRIDTATARPHTAALEALHFTPYPQPPIETFDSMTFRRLRDEFNLAADRPRVLLLLSPSCPYCLKGANAIQKVFATLDSVPLRVFVVWMHGTKSDRDVPNSLVLARISDRRAMQFWDPSRLLAHTMYRELPPDTAAVLADTAGGTPLIWDAVALYRAGARWEDRFPTPDYASWPVVDAVEPVRRLLARWTETASH